MRYTSVAPVIALAVASIVLASVFAYYPLTIKIQPQAPGVAFQAGSNAGQPDIGTKTITVTIGDNRTSAKVEIHPTYQETYYKDVLRIYNGDDNVMNVYLIFDEVTPLPSGCKVWMFVYTGGEVKKLDITAPSTGELIPIGQISAGAAWQIDFYVKIPEGTSITGASYTASAKLAYTPSSETPPANPSGGR